MKFTTYCGIRAVLIGAIALVLSAAPPREISIAWLRLKQAGLIRAA